MESYQTEEEQIEALKHWWKENGKAILLGIFLAIVLIFGWQGWQKHQQKRAAQASQLFEAFVNVLLAKAVDDSIDQAKIDEPYNLLNSDFKKSTYREYADLLMAGSLVQKNQLDKATETLEKVLASSKDKDILSIARIRLARIKIDKKEYTQAEELLSKGILPSWASIVKEINGDIQFDQKNLAAAAVLYKEAIELKQQENLRVSSALLMKAASAGVNVSPYVES